MRRANNHSQKNNFTLGLVILLIGVFFLLRKMGIFFPEWLFSWPIIFIVLGMVILIKNRFQSGFGFLMLLFGSFFLIRREIGIPGEISQYAIPFGLILFGLYLMVYRKNNKSNNWGEWAKEKSLPRNAANEDNPPVETISGKDRAHFYNDSGEILQTQALFCGVQKRVLSKSFQGGKISAIFGSAEIDLRQADFAGKVFLNVEVAFGGIDLIVPPHWDIQMSVTNVFAGIEDKRIYPQSATDLSKVLLISGTVIFGGLEIKSF